MQYCKTDEDFNFNISYMNCQEILDNYEPYGKMKDTFDLMKRILLGSYGFHGRLKQFIKGPSYGQILFHKKGDLNEKIV
jgi:hypothetical protein